MIRAGPRARQDALTVRDYLFLWGWLLCSLALLLGYLFV